MKRINNLYQKITTLENLELSDKKARKGKNVCGVTDIKAIQKMLLDKTFTTSNYSTFKIYEPKERLVYRLPYFPDRVVHHAIMNILEPVFVAMFTKDSYSCIKGKGVHAAANAVRLALKNKDLTRYCLKLDIKKFYPTIDHAILKQLLSRKIKDNDLLWLMGNLIDSADGLPIGNYLSQYFANFYLTYFDHWIKEKIKVKHYFRYADDIVILSDSKEYLHTILAEIKNYLSENLKLTVKENYQIFPVEKRGIDFVGYVFYHTHTKIRKSIKQNFARMLVSRKNPASIASYNGWLKHCNCRNLQRKLLKIA
ncbi:MAG: reverse transcriptase/maturase family protein [Candidatus Methylacidiphilales bacterium]